MRRDHPAQRSSQCRRRPLGANDGHLPAEPRSSSIVTHLSQPDRAATAPPFPHGRALEAMGNAQSRALNCGSCTPSTVPHACGATRASLARASSCSYRAAARLLPLRVNMRRGSPPVGERPVTSYSQTNIPRGSCSPNQFAPCQPWCVANLRSVDEVIEFGPCSHPVASEWMRGGGALSACPCAGSDARRNCRAGH